MSKLFRSGRFILPYNSPFIISLSYTKQYKYDIIYSVNGSVAERLKAAVLKTVVGLPLPEVRILSLPPKIISLMVFHNLYYSCTEK